MTTHTFEIDDITGFKTLKIAVSDDSGSLTIEPCGYGDFSSQDFHGCPIFLELYEGRLRLVTYADINEQDPTIVDMENALETNRKEL
jgi:hypothetical protein